jgi:predicted phosphodiesterase
MRILHTADIHLRDGEDERWKALETVVEVSVAREVDVLVIAGDLFDRGIDARRLRAPLRSLFAKTAARVIVIPGNHDESGLADGDFLGDNVTLVTDASVPLDVDAVRFIGVPFQEADVADTARILSEAARHRRQGATNVLVFHGELLDLVPGSGAFGDEGGREYMPVRLETFSRLGFDYVLAGHFHKRFRTVYYEGGVFVYPGSPVSVTRRETGRRQAALLTPGEVPAGVELQTEFFAEVVVDLAPDDVNGPIERIRTVLASAPAGARILLTVEGFVHLASVGMNESLFAQAIDALRAEFAIEPPIQQNWQDVSVVLDHDLFRKFTERLETSGLQGPEREAARTMAMEALMEVLHAR